MFEICVAATLLGAACSGGSAKQSAPSTTGVTSSTSSPRVAFIDDGPLTGPRAYSAGYISLLPPPRRASHLTALAAFTAYRADPVFPLIKPPTPHLVLAKATIFDYGRGHGNGTVTPVIDSRLVWVVRFDNVPASAIGGPGGPVRRPGATPRTAPAGGAGSTVLVFVDAVTGDVLDGQGTGTSPSTTPALTCPARAFDRVPPHQIAGTASTFVPGHPNALLACRYHALNQPQPAGSLARSKRLAPGDIVGALNAQPPIPKHQIRECGPDSGGIILLILGYADGNRLSIAIDTSGCHTAFNGDYAIDMEPRTLDLLNAYLGQDHQRFG